MHTYLVVFECLTMTEPFFEHIKADNLHDARQQAHQMSVEHHQLSDGNFSIYRLMTDDDYATECPSSDDCPLGGDVSNDCEDCAYSCDYHCVDGECVRR